MKTLLELYKWQIALAVTLLYIVWPYINTVVAFLSSNDLTAKRLIEASFVSFALLTLVGVIVYVIWASQRPTTRRSKPANP